MKKRLEFVLSKNKMLNANQSLHYQAKGNRVRVLREIARVHGVELQEKEGPFLFNTFKVTVTVCPPTRRRLDPPNLYPTSKALIDGLTDAQWWEDDNFSHLLDFSFRYGGLSGEKDFFKVILEIEEISPEGYITEAEIAEVN